MQVYRCFKPKNFGEIKNVQLHISSDGSRVGYGAVAYLRLVDVFDRIHCSFGMGKARLAPIHKITIPRLELTAAAISVKLGLIIREELEIETDRVNYRTDSTTVPVPHFRIKSAHHHSQWIVCFGLEIRQPR